MPNLEPISKRKKFMITFAAIAIAALIGVLASYFMGPDSPVEQTVENVIDEVIEHELHLPDDSINIDLSPDK